jgi:hypothetical protein
MQTFSFRTKQNTIYSLEYSESLKKATHKIFDDSGKPLHLIEYFPIEEEEYIEWASCFFRWYGSIGTPLSHPSSHPLSHPLEHKKETLCRFWLHRFWGFLKRKFWKIF